MEDHRSIKVNNSKKVRKQTLLETFNKLGAHSWIKLSTMKTNYPYIITNTSKQETKFGPRVVVELEENLRLSLPSRYNNINDKQLLELGSSKYVLINKGRDQDRKSYSLELCKKEEVESEAFLPTNSQPLENDNDDEEQLNYYSQKHFLGM